MNLTNFKKCALGLTGLLFAASSQASLSPSADRSIAPIQDQLLAAAPRKAPTIQLAARVISRSRINASANTNSSISGSISSPFFTPFVPSTAVGATIPAPGTGITPTPRVVVTKPSHSQGFVRQYTPIRHRATYIP